MVGVFDQVTPGYAAVNYLEDPVYGGRINNGGIQVQPTQGPNADFPGGDPLVQTVARRAGTEPVIPSYVQTREAAQQDPAGKLPWWLLGLAMLTIF